MENLPSDVCKIYLQMLKKLDNIRHVHGCAESKEEDNLLEEMDKIWLELTKNDFKIISGV